MADSPSEVWKMIKELQSKSKTGAKSELQALQVTNPINKYILKQWIVFFARSDWLLSQ